MFKIRQQVVFGAKASSLYPSSSSSSHTASEKPQFKTISLILKDYTVLPTDTSVDIAADTNTDVDSNTNSDVDVLADTNIDTTNDVKPINLDHPILFNKDTDKNVKIYWGDKKILEGKSNIRYEGTSTTPNNPTDKPFGIFSLVELDKSIQKTVLESCISIDNINLAILSPAQAAYAFEGMDVMSEAQQFTKTNLTAQTEIFLKKNPRINAVVQLMQLYKSNHPDQTKDNPYLVLTQSIKFLAVYQSIPDKSDKLPEFVIGDQLATITECLTGDKMKTAFTTANGDAIFKVIKAALDLQNILQITADATAEAMTEANLKFKAASLSL